MIARKKILRMAISESFVIAKASMPKTGCGPYCFDSRWQCPRLQEGVLPSLVSTISGMLAPFKDQDIVFQAASFPQPGGLARILPPRSAARREISFLSILMSNRDFLYGSGPLWAEAGR